MQNSRFECYQEEGSMYNVRPRKLTIRRVRILRPGHFSGGHNFQKTVVTLLPCSKLYIIYVMS